MHSLEGRSFAIDGATAVAEATRDWPHDLEPEIVLVFMSTKQEPEAVAAELTRRFPQSLVTGCTTSGEQLSGDHLDGALVITALVDTGVQWTATRIDDLAAFDAARAEGIACSLFGALGIDREAFDPHECFALLLIDGLCRREEVVTALVADALDGVPLAGGSAGDDLAFRSTKVLLDGRASSDAAIVVMGRGAGRFSILKHQHYTTTPRRLVITRCDTPARRVFEINGRPALDAYAAALGLSAGEVDDRVTFMNPVTFSCRGEIYVRSIQSVQPDGSIVFYCGVEEGMVLEIGDHHDMPSALAADVARLTEKRGRGAFMLTFNCILRRLEAKQAAHEPALGEVLRSASKSSIGFDTYGEQLDGLHINQTLVALILHEAA